MPISKERLEEFVRVWEEAFGERLSLAEAGPLAERLMIFARRMVRPLPAGIAPSLEGMGDPGVQAGDEASGR